MLLFGWGMGSDPAAKGARRELPPVGQHVVDLWVSRTINHDNPCYWKQAWNQQSNLPTEHLNCATESGQEQESTVLKLIASLPVSLPLGFAARRPFSQVLCARMPIWRTPYLCEERTDLNRINCFY